MHTLASPHRSPCLRETEQGNTKNMRARHFTALPSAEKCQPTVKRNLGAIQKVRKWTHRNWWIGRWSGCNTQSVCCALCANSAISDLDTNSTSIETDATDITSSPS